MTENEAAIRRALERLGASVRECAADEDRTGLDQARQWYRHLKGELRRLQAENEENHA